MTTLAALAPWIILTAACSAQLAVLVWLTARSTPPF
jgi:hypothetical protein